MEMDAPVEFNALGVQPVNNGVLFISWSIYIHHFWAKHNNTLYILIPQLLWVFSFTLSFINKYSHLRATKMFRVFQGIYFKKSVPNNIMFRSSTLKIFSDFLWKYKSMWFCYVWFPPNMTEFTNIFWGENMFSFLSFFYFWNFFHILFNFVMVFNIETVFKIKIMSLILK